MGFFFDITKAKLLREVEFDGNPSEDNEEPTDYTADSGDQSTDQQNDAGGNDEQQATDDTQQQDAGDDTSQDQGDDSGEEETTDYTEMGDEEGDGSTDDSGGDTSTADTSSTGEESEVDDIKQKEEEIYSNLTPEQLDIKHKELKNQFLEMYDIVVAIIERIGETSTSEENIGTVQYISTNLTNLKDMLTDYMNSVYKTKSYMENSINYNRFLAVLNGINKIIEEMNKKEEN